MYVLDLMDDSFQLVLLYSLWYLVTFRAQCVFWANFNVSHVISRFLHWTSPHSPRCGVLTPRNVGIGKVHVAIPHFSVYGSAIYFSILQKNALEAT